MNLNAVRSQAFVSYISLYLAPGYQESGWVLTCGERVWDLNRILYRILLNDYQLNCCLFKMAAKYVATDPL